MNEWIEKKTNEDQSQQQKQRHLLSRWHYFTRSIKLILFYLRNKNNFNNTYFNQYCFSIA